MAFALCAGCVFQGDYASVFSPSDSTTPAGCTTQMSDEDLCAQAEVACGEVELVDECGTTRTVECPDTCGGELCFNNACVCRSESDEDICAALSAGCGMLTAVDSCGISRALHCGQCEFPNRCVDEGAGDVCACEPVTVCPEEIECGGIDDGCGAILDCGREDCPAERPNCSADNTCQVADCVPKTCESEEAECGTVADGCGQTLNCGTCPDDELCSGENICACVPRTCEQLQVECGEVDDGCGTTIFCNSCPEDDFFYCDEKKNACICQPQGNIALCRDYDKLCGDHDLVDRCGTARTVDCNPHCMSTGGRCSPKGDCSRINTGPGGGPGGVGVGPG